LKPADEKQRRRLKEMPKIVIIGDSQVGKSMFVRRLLGGQYKRKWNYVPTMGVEVCEYYHNGRTFELWDCAGSKKLRGLGDGYFIGADAALLISRCPAESIQWITDFQRVRPDSPIIPVDDYTIRKPKKQFIEAANDLFDQLETVLAAATKAPVPETKKALSIPDKVDMLHNHFLEIQKKLDNIRDELHRKIEENAAVAKKMKFSKRSLDEKIEKTNFILEKSAAFKAWLQEIKRQEEELDTVLRFNSKK